MLSPVNPANTQLNPQRQSGHGSIPCLSQLSWNQEWYFQIQTNRHARGVLMSSELKIEANRQNAQHSTGPSTPEGRAAVRLNGLKHGLCAETIVVPGEDPAEFEALLEDYRAEYQPATPSAEFLVRQLAMADWRLLRLHRVEAAFHNFRHKEISDTRREDLDLDDT